MTTLTSNEIFALIEKIAATPGKNDKVALVAAHSEDAEFKRVLVASNDPLISYGIKKRPATIGDHVGHEFDAGTWEVIDDLASRKLTGNLAIEAIAGEMTALSADSAELFWRIITKDLRAGFGDGTINKAIKGLIREYPYMRCSLPKKMKLDASFGWSDGVISQTKADGMFMNLDIEDAGVVSLRTRQGNEIPMGQFAVFADAARRMLRWGTETHGEMIVMKMGKVLPREEGNGILNHITSGGAFEPDEIPLFLAWDQIPLTAVVPKGKYSVPYRERLKDLVQQLQANPDVHLKLIPTKVVYSMKQAWDHYREMLAQNKEGTVFKKGAAIWKDGTSTEQGKLKLKAPCELRVKGFNEGTGKFAGQLGSLICESECGKLRVNVSGRGDAMRAAVWADKDGWLESIIMAEGNQVMEPSEEGGLYSIFLPIFGERRTDKSVADTLEQIQAQFEAAKDAA